VASGGVTPELLRDAQVAVEFTVSAAAAWNIRGCVAAGVPVVSGTTGWDPERPGVEAEVRRSGGALLWSPNFAVGVHVFARIVEEAARAVGHVGGFDAHLLETHHARKRDAPSGTARLLAARAKAGLSREITITSVRTGSVPGTHEMLFDAEFEQLRLVHEARDRRVFAAGALAAARWIVGRTGVFTMDDLLRGEP
jgi:4-hydroxy-tetrahydrodipicolinate reductase